MKTPVVLVLLAISGCPALLQTASAQPGSATLYTFTNGFPVGLTLGYGGLYGAFAAAYGCGDIFYLQPPAAGGDAWTQTVLYTFADTNDACDPVFGPIIGPDGVLYGVSSSGGANNAGAFYELQPPASPGGAWTESVLYSFSAGGPFAPPVSPLVPGPDYSFYWANDSGVVQLKRPAAGGAWTATVLESIPAGPTCIASGPGGTLYVTTKTGAGEIGQIIQLVPPATPGSGWTELTIYDLTLSQEVSLNSVAVSSDGTLYGTTSGTTVPFGAFPAIFQLSPPTSPGGVWTYTLLTSFGVAQGVFEPIIPRVGWLISGITTGGGAGVFAMAPPSAPGDYWTLNFLHSFTGQPNAASLVPSTLLMDTTGIIYGATQSGNTSGTVYRILP